MADVIEFRPPPRAYSAKQRADAWEAVVRMMEANGRTKLEISLDDAKWIAELARRHVCD